MVTPHPAARWAQPDRDRRVQDQGRHQKQKGVRGDGEALKTDVQPVHGVNIPHTSVIGGAEIRGQNRL